jgi:hypothetical protein
MKIPLSQKLVLMPRNLSWWVWAITAACMAVGLIGYSSGFYVAILISLIQTVVYDLKQTSALSFPVQIRFAYTILLILCQVPPPQMALLGADCGNICPRSLRLLLHGPDSLTPTREPHRASELGSYPAGVSDAARRVRSRRANRESFRPYEGL